MKYYLVIFSDYSETVGSYNTKAEAEKAARHYCKIWNLAETLREVQEITADEYSRRTGKPAPEPAKDEKPKKNRLPRKFTRLYFTMLIDTTAAKAGEAVTVSKNENNEYILTNAAGENYCTGPAMLRNADIMTLDRVEAQEAPKQPESEPEQIKPREETHTEKSSPEEAENGPTTPAADAARETDTRTETEPPRAQEKPETDTDGATAAEAANEPPQATRRAAAPPEAVTRDTHPAPPESVPGDRETTPQTTRGRPRQTPETAPPQAETPPGIQTPTTAPKARHGPSRRCKRRAQRKAA